MNHNEPQPSHLPSPAPRFTYSSSLPPNTKYSRPTHCYYLSPLNRITPWLPPHPPSYIHITVNLQMMRWTRTKVPSSTSRSILIWNSLSAAADELKECQRWDGGRYKCCAPSAPHNGDPKHSKQSAASGTDQEKVDDVEQSALPFAQIPEEIK